MKQLVIILLLLFTVSLVPQSEIQGVVWCKPFTYFETQRTLFTIILMMDVMTSVVCYTDRVDLMRVSPLYIVPDEVRYWRIPAGIALGLTTHYGIKRIYNRNKLLGNIVYTLVNSAYASVTGHNFVVTFIFRPRISP